MVNTGKSPDYILSLYLKKNRMEKISVISGGTSGLGLEIAGLLLKRGKNVLVLGRNKARLAVAGERLKKSAGTNLLMLETCNIGNEKEVDRIGFLIRTNKLSVEYLFNNAGIGCFAKADSSTSQMIESVFESNLKGMILLTSLVLRLTPEDEELTIVNIMSTSALLGRAEETIYCASKWGARGYTEALRSELKGTKRNIIAVYPGGMRTDFWKAPGQNRDISSFMDPAEVAGKIADAVLITGKLVVTDITINRK
jgi:uncharacterized protein